MYLMLKQTERGGALFLEILKYFILDLEILKEQSRTEELPHSSAYFQNKKNPALLSNIK